MAHQNIAFPNNNVEHTGNQDESLDWDGPKGESVTAMTHHSARGPCKRHRHHLQHQTTQLQGIRPRNRSETWCRTDPRKEQLLEWAGTDDSLWTRCTSRPCVYPPQMDAAQQVDDAGPSLCKVPPSDGSRFEGVLPQASFARGGVLEWVRVGRSLSKTADDW